jgi:hypothetical protein
MTELLVGHLVADFCFQNDWMAANKGNPHPGPAPIPEGAAPNLPPGDEGDEIIRAQWAWKGRRALWRKGHLACALHVTVYTAVVWLFSFWWMPWWGPICVWLPHFLIDRFRLARRYMDYSGQRGFATGPMAPWSVVAVDQAMHALCLLLVAAACGRLS